jgi:hypothetical protein
LPIINEAICKKLDEVAVESGFRRVLPRLPYNELGSRGKRYKVSSGQKFIDLITKCMAGDQSENLKNDIIKKYLPPKSHMENHEKFISLLENIAKLYRESQSKLERLDILSLVTPILPYTTITQFIPSLTHYYFIKSRKLAKNELRQEPKLKKERFDPAKVTAFVEFICRSVKTFYNNF